jgi:hypothetical protein
MLSDRTRHPFAIDETAPPADRAMQVLQYLTAVIAAVAAMLLTRFS